MVQSARDALRRLGASGRSLLVAVSGGADSMVLLHVLWRLREALGLTLEVASVDHGLRPEAAQEVAEVGRVAGALGLTFHPIRVSIEGRSGIEEKARAARYEALESVRRARGLALIATAHTADDQAETLLMRLARGASLRGAAGILEARGRVIRPLLGCTRAQVRAFAEKERICWVRDPMNEDPAFLRVRIRRSVLPALEAAAGRDVAVRLARFARMAREDEALLGELAQAAFGRLRLVGEAGEVALDAVGVRALTPALRRRVIARLVEQAGVEGIDAEGIDRALQAIDEGGTCQLPGGRLLRAGGGMVRMETPEEARSGRRAAARVEVLEPDGPPVVTEVGEVRWRLGRPAVSDLEGGTVQAIPVDASARLRVRSRRRGDRVRLPNGRTRKLQDVLVDAKVPRELRDVLPLVVTESDEVICVAGIWPRPGWEPARGPRSWIQQTPSKKPASSRRPRAL